MPDPHESLEALRARQAAARAERAAIDLDDPGVHLRATAIVACGLCDDDGYRGNRVCDHTDRSAARKRGMQLIREALGGKNAEG